MRSGSVGARGFAFGGSVAEVRGRWWHKVYDSGSVGAGGAQGRHLKALGHWVLERVAPIPNRNNSFEM